MKEQNTLIEIESLKGFKVNLPKLPKWWQLLLVLVALIILLILLNVTLEQAQVQEILQYIASIRAG